MKTAKIQFTDTSKECIKMMQKLSKDALKKAGKVVTTKLKDKMPVKTGGLKKSIVAWAIVDRQTGIPSLQVGYRSRKQMAKRGVKYFVNPWWFEFGTRPHRINVKKFNDKGFAMYKLSNGYQDFGFSVQHPGMSNKNFLRNTVYDNIEEINSVLQVELKKLEEYQIEQGMNINIGEDEEID